MLGLRYRAARQTDAVVMRADSIGMANGFDDHNAAEMTTACYAIVVALLEVSGMSRTMIRAEG